MGYVEAGGLGAPEPATHRVSALLATLYPAPDIMTAPLGVLPLNAALAGREEGPFLATEAGFVHLRHVVPAGTFAEDFVAVAELFLGAPYLWGGGTALGLDCSGLVQAAFHAAGRDAPRDSDMQAAEIGAPIPEGAPQRRGDLIFWRGHVGIMRDAATLLHANGRHMAVASEPLDEAVARIAREYGPVTARRRP
jgi:cell wall-associated NlpC family hydrolase